MRTLYCHVLDNGGFTFGMDGITPVSWAFSARPRRRGVYRTFTIPRPSTAQIATAIPRICTLRQLCAIMGVA